MLSVAAEHGFDTVEGEYLKTAKNAMVANSYEKLGSSPMGDGRFVAHTANFTPNKTHISEE